jgi:DnaA family protein
MSSGPQQIPLKFHAEPSLTFQNFVATDSSEAAVSALRELVSSRQGTATGAPVLLWGGSCSGKTHLLNALCTEAGQQGVSAAMVPAEYLRDRHNLGLIEAFDLLALDEVHRLAGDREGEGRLFDWINHLRQAGKPFVMASRLAPNDPAWKLPDLVSRLNWGRAWQLPQLSRQQALAVFQQRAALRGLKLDDTVLGWLQRHHAGDLGFLLQLLERMDETSLRTRRRVTVPLLKELLATSSD